MLTDSFMEPGFLAAVFICLVTLIMPLFSRELRQSESIVVGYWIVVGLHQVVAFVNAYIFTGLGTPDSRGFQQWSEALIMSGELRFLMGAHFYKHALSAVYIWLSPSHLLGEQLSILVFAFSCIVFLKIMRQLGLVRFRLFSLLAFGALPTMVILGSITLRESYEVFFFMLAVYYGIKMHMKEWPNIYFIALILSALGMGWFHTALIVYAAFLVLIFFVWSLRPATRLGNIKKLHLAAFVIIPLFLMSMLVLSRLEMPELEYLLSLFNQNISLDNISTFRNNSISLLTRATYVITFDHSSSYTMVYSGLKMYVYYMLAPFPWQVGSLTDLYGATESIMRMVLIYFSVKNWRNASGSQRRLLGLMLILYFSMTIMWAVGTTNYGTAIRHHMLTWWIIVIVGFPSFMEKLGRFSLGLKMSRPHPHLKRQI